MANRTCSVDGCEDKVSARGYCNKHHLRWRKHGDPLGGNASPSVRKSIDTDDGRICTSCHRTLPFDSFDKDKNASGGRRSQCKECRSSKMKKWYSDNRDRQAQRQRDRVADHPERIREQDSERYRRNKPKRLDLAKEGSHRRRARKFGAPIVETVTVGALRERDGDRCCYCGTPMSFSLAEDHVYIPLRATIEHVVPLSLGGAHSMENAALACWQCNVRKGDRTVEEWKRACEEGEEEAPGARGPKDLHAAA